MKPAPPVTNILIVNSPLKILRYIEAIFYGFIFIQLSFKCKWITPEVFKIGVYAHAEMLCSIIKFLAG
jgi:hypothetical protein